MPATSILAKDILTQYRPQYTSAQRLIRKSSEYESLYTPEALLPDEIDVTLYDKFIQFTFRYTPQESATGSIKLPNRNVHIVAGKRTKKIQSIRIDFDDRSVKSLLQNLDQCAIVIKRLKSTVSLEVMQKSYEIVREYVLHVREQISSDADAIQETLLKTN